MSTATAEKKTTEKPTTEKKPKAKPKPKTPLEKLTVATRKTVEFVQTTSMEPQTRTQVADFFAGVEQVVESWRQAVGTVGPTSVHGLLVELGRNKRTIDQALSATLTTDADKAGF